MDYSTSPFVSPPYPGFPGFAPAARTPLWLRVGLTCPGLDHSILREAEGNITPYLSIRGLRAEVVRCCAYPQSYGMPWDGRWVEIAVLNDLLTDGQAARIVGRAVQLLQDPRAPSGPLPRAVLAPWKSLTGRYDCRTPVVGAWLEHAVVTSERRGSRHEENAGTTLYGASGNGENPIQSTIDTGQLYTNAGRDACRKHTDELGCALGAVLWEQITLVADEEILREAQAQRKTKDY